MRVDDLSWEEAAKRYGKPYTLDKPPADYWFIRELDIGIGIEYALYRIKQNQIVEEIPWIDRHGNKVLTRQPYLRGAFNWLPPRYLNGDDILLTPAGFRSWDTLVEQRAAKKAAKAAKIRPKGG